MESIKVTFPVKHVEKSRLSGIDFDNFPFGSVFNDHMHCAEFRDGHWEEPCIKAHRLSNERIALFRPCENFVWFNQSAERFAMPKTSESLFFDGIAELVRLDNEWTPRTERTGLYQARRELPIRSRQSLAERIREKLVAIPSGRQSDVHRWPVEI